MDVGFTFGSFGDIITLCHLVKVLGNALGLGPGGVSTSANKYQDLRKALDNFEHVLIQVVATCGQHETCPLLAHLAQSTEQIANECGALIKTALDRLVPKYQDSLQQGGSTNKIKDAFKKVKWVWKDEQSFVEELQQKLRDNTEQLSFFMTANVR
ncbi:hypothetical protein ACHAQA_005963 [Verticillium albo-atrum]